MYDLIPFLSTTTIIGLRVRMIKAVYLMNSNVQSNVGLGRAIAVFTNMGVAVSLPLTESQRYDLIVDMEGILLRVEVKTTTYKRRHYEVGLQTAGRNGKRTPLSREDCDLVFVYTMDGAMYLFPITAVEGKTNLVLSKDKDQYKID